MRSGSSFLGELFNMNDDFTYFFEPLRDVRKIIYKANDSIILMKYLQVLLRNILKCDFKNMPIHWWHPPMESNIKSRPACDCSLSEAFHNSSLCTYNERKREYVPIRFVENNVTVLEDLCRSRKHVALKSIRVADIYYLRNLVEDSRMNVKIIHLVRDPRGAYNSRLRVKWPPTIQESLRATRTEYEIVVRHTRMVEEQVSSLTLRRYCCCTSSCCRRDIQISRDPDAAFR